MPTTTKINLAGPLRVNAFGVGHVGRRKKPVAYGYQVWSPVQLQSFGEGRLPGAGTFFFAGFLQARQAARKAFDNPAIHQTQIRTNQDRTVFVWNRQTDGRVTGYNAERD